MSDSSTQINSKCIDKSSKKSYINWKLPNCGEISIHGEKTCFVTIKDSDKSECKCVNRVSAFLPFYGWFSRYPAISAVDCFSRHGTHTVSPYNQP